MLPILWLQLPTLCARDKEHRLRDRLHFCNSGLKMKQILTKHFSSCGYWKRMILCLSMYQNSILGATLRTHLEAPRLLSRPQPPFLLLLLHRSVFPAAHFIVPTPPQSLDLHMLNHQILSPHWRWEGRQGGRRDESRRENGVEIWTSAPGFFPHAQTRTSLTWPSTHPSPPTFSWLHDFSSSASFLFLLLGHYWLIKCPILSLCYTAVIFLPLALCLSGYSQYHCQNKILKTQTWPHHSTSYKSVNAFPFHIEYSVKNTAYKCLSGKIFVINLLSALYANRTVHS